MQSKNWGAFICDCRSTLNVEQKKIGVPVPLVKLQLTLKKKFIPLQKKLNSMTSNMFSLDAVPNRQYLSKPCQEKHFISWISRVSVLPLIQTLKSHTSRH